VRCSGLAGRELTGLGVVVPHLIEHPGECESGADEADDRADEVRRRECGLPMCSSRAGRRVDMDVGHQMQQSAHADSQHPCQVAAPIDGG
jgi:hypothetical protein